MDITLSEFLNFTFRSGWTFFGMILLIGSVGGLIKSILSFIPKRIHIGGVQHIEDVHTKVVEKKSEK